MLFPLSVAFKQTPNLNPANSFVSNPTRVETDGLFELPKNSNSAWAWIAGGVIIGALIAKSGDSNADTANNPDNGAGTLIINTSGSKF